MALDGVEVMEHLGFRQFRMVGHDRGARVGRRMAIDHPDRVLKLAVLDIVPAHYLYSHVTLDFVRGYPHWFTYLLPAPGPENDLVAAAKRQAEQATSDVQREYSRHRVKFEMEHCMCEDYRASASVDLKIDHDDIKAGKITRPRSPRTSRRFLQEKCQACHRAGSMAPMSLVTYEETRPWAKAIKQRRGHAQHAALAPR